MKVIVGLQEEEQLAEQQQQFAVEDAEAAEAVEGDRCLHLLVDRFQKIRSHNFLFANPKSRITHGLQNPRRVFCTFRAISNMLIMFYFVPALNSTNKI
jgi:hypothetical protein